MLWQSWRRFMLWYSRENGILVTSVIMRTLFYQSLYLYPICCFYLFQNQSVGIRHNLKKKRKITLFMDFSWLWMFTATAEQKLFFIKRPPFHRPLCTELIQKDWWLIHYVFVPPPSSTSIRGWSSQQAPVFKILRIKGGPEYQFSHVSPCFWGSWK